MPASAIPRFYLFTPKLKYSIIELRYRKKGMKLVYSLEIKIPTQYWNFNTQRVKSTKSYSSWKTKNKIIEQVCTIIEKVEDDLILNGKPLHKEPFREALDIYFNKKTAKKTDRLQFLDQNIEAHLEEVKGLIADGTLTKRRKILKKLQEFQIYSNKRYTPDDIKQSWLNQFLKWGYHEKNYQTSYLKSILKVLKIMMRAARKNGWHNASNFEDLAIRNIIPSKTTRKTDVYLTIKEIDSIRKLDIEAYEAERDVMVALFYLGMRFEDYYETEKSNLIEIVNKEGKKVKCLRSINEKTNLEVINPIPRVLDSILEKYNYVLPKIGNIPLNRKIKEICRQAGITQIIDYVDDKGGKLNHYSNPKCELITCHTMRRSLITHLNNQGLSLKDSGAVAGHSDIKTTMKYIKETPRETALRLAQMPFFAEE